METNGKGNELAQALEKIIAAFARINTALRSLLERMLRLSESQDASSERSERQYEALREKLDALAQAQALRESEILILLRAGSKKLDDITDEIPKYDPSNEPKEKTGPAAAIGRLIDNVAPGWVGWVIKLAPWVAGGFGLDRLVHFLSTGHW